MDQTTPAAAGAQDGAPAPVATPSPIDQAAAELQADINARAAEAAEPAPAEPAPETPAQSAPVATDEDARLLAIARDRAALRAERAKIEAERAGLRDAVLDEMRRRVTADPKAVYELLGEDLLPKLVHAEIGKERIVDADEKIGELAKVVEGLKAEIQKRDAEAQAQKGQALVQAEVQKVRGIVESGAFPWLRSLDLGERVWQEAVAYYQQTGEAPPSYEAIASQLEKQVSQHYAARGLSLGGATAQTPKVQDATQGQGRRPGTLAATTAPPPRAARATSAEEAVALAAREFGLVS